MRPWQAVRASVALPPRPSRARWAVSASCSAVCDHICCCTAGAGTGAGDPPLRSRPPKTMWWSTWRTTWPAAAAGVVTAGGCVPLRSCCHSAQQQLLPSGTVVATTGSSAAVSTLHRGSWAGCLRRAASVGSSGPGVIGAVVRVGAAATSGEATAPRCRSWSGRAGGSKSVGCDRRRLGKPPVQPGGALQPHPVWPRYSREAVRRGSCVCSVRDVCASRGQP